jgi:hypothetical protein
VKPHQPSEDRDNALIRAAVSFNAHFRRSPYEKWNVAAATLQEARAAAVGLAQAHGTPAGRQAQVYAIGATGVATFVPSSFVA